MITAVVSKKGNCLCSPNDRSICGDWRLYKCTMNWLIQYLEVSETYLPQLSVRLVCVYWFIKFYCTAKCILAYSSIIVAVSTDKCCVFFPFFSCARWLLLPSGKMSNRKNENDYVSFTEDRNISQSLYIELWWLLVMEICSPFFPQIIGEVRFAAESFFMKINAVLPFWRCI